MTRTSYCEVCGNLTQQTRFCSSLCVRVFREAERQQEPPTNPGRAVVEEHQLGDLEWCPCGCGRTRGQVRQLGHASTDSRGG